MSAALVAAARAAQRNAHCPYSNFHVGAAIEATDGATYAGCNVESASYGDPPAAPCGACRQLLAEFGLDFEVIAVGKTTERRWTLRQLLPDAFTRETLGT